MPGYVKDITLQRFGKLTVLYRACGVSKGAVKWLCTCDCGTVRDINGHSVRSGLQTSCGCDGKRAREKDRTYAILKVLFKLNIVGSPASKRGLERNITFDEYVQMIHKPCVYCGTEWSNIAKDKATKEVLYHNGIDRIDPTKGYILENCVPCCKHCNRSKFEQSKEEYFSYIKRVYEFNKLGE